jgi:hypothetical protein
LTKRGRVLLCIAHDPGVRLRDIAATVGITERSAYGNRTFARNARRVKRDRHSRDSAIRCLPRVASRASEPADALPSNAVSESLMARQGVPGRRSGYWFICSDMAQSRSAASGSSA